VPSTMSDDAHTIDDGGGADDGRRRPDATERQIVDAVVTGTLVDLHDTGRPFQVHQAASDADREVRARLLTVLLIADQPTGAPASRHSAVRGKHHGLAEPGSSRSGLPAASGELLVR
jgi:hypothetical protein